MAGSTSPAWILLEVLFLSIFLNLVVAVIALCCICTIQAGIFVLYFNNGTSGSGKRIVGLPVVLVFGYKKSLFREY